MELEGQYFELSTLSPTRLWNYEKPTLTKEGRFTDRKLWLKSSTFWKHFTELFPVFKDVSISGLAIAGGCCVDLLIDNRSINDIDLYLIVEENSKNPCQLLANRVEKLLEDIFAWMEAKKIEKEKEKKENRNSNLFSVHEDNRKFNIDNILVTRFKSVYTIVAPCVSVPIQVSVRRSLKEIFENLYPSCTEVIFYKNELLFSKKGKESIESLTVEMAPREDYKNIYERMIKYFEKGFDIILPNLDIEKLPQRKNEYDENEAFDLNGFVIVYNSINKNKINITKLKIAKNLIRQEHLNKDSEKENELNQSLEIFSDGSNIESGYNYKLMERNTNTCLGIRQNSGRNLNAENINKSVGFIIHQNIKKLVSGKFDKFIYWGKGECFRNAMVPTLFITERMLKNSYEKKFNKFHLNMNIPLLEEYFSIKPIDEIINELFVKYISNKKNSGKVFDNNCIKHMKNYVEALVEPQIDYLKKLVIDLNTKLSLEFPLFEKFNIVNPKTFYGEFFKE